MPKARPLRDRVWDKVIITDTCWLWSGGTNGTGYGNVASGPKQDFQMLYVHRLVYEWLVGPIPAGLTIDHLCRVRRCCRPDHLEAVSHRVNNQRASMLEEACKKGHPRDKWLYVNPNNGKRSCKACKLEHQREKRRRLEGGDSITR